VNLGGDIPGREWICVTDGKNDGFVMIYMIPTTIFTILDS